MNHVLTISREFGSGGREIGQQLAEQLKIPFYDKELITLAAQDCSMTEELLNHFDERFLRSFHPVPRFSLFGCYQQPITDQVYLAQRKVIRQLADNGPCVIVGRCANHILEKKAVNLFIHADMNSRIRRKEAMGIPVSESSMEQHIRSVDKIRKRYYEHHTDQRWGDAARYQLCVDTTDIGINGAVKTILCYLSFLD